MSNGAAQSQQQQQQRRNRQLLSDPDHAEAVAPVETSRFSVEPPTYVSPQGSRGSLEDVEKGGSATNSKEQQIHRRPPRQEAAEGAAATQSGSRSDPVQVREMQNQQYAREVHRQPEESPQGSRCCEILLIVLSGLLVALTFPFSLCVCIKIVQQYERAVIFRLGRIQGPPKGPGLFFILTCIDKMQVVDLRTVTFDVPPQEILTKDSVTIAVDAVVYYRIFDPVRATVDIEDVHRATRLLAQTNLRNILGTKTLHEILGEREIIAHAMQSHLDEATDPWGVKVERVEVKDVRLPVQMQRAMAAEAEALREAKAKVIAAEGEQKASRSLKEAADVISESPGALQLRYLQTLNTIAAEKNSTIIFPLPIDLLQAFMKR